ncbi:MAG: hypothetical protein FJW26_03605 [Acidimicrobiia bacterium]|nr:hypothetical protein [Acidimicrobiia bacterium]
MRSVSQTQFRDLAGAFAGLFLFALPLLAEQQQPKRAALTWRLVPERVLFQDSFTGDKLSDWTSVSGSFRTVGGSENAVRKLVATSEVTLSFGQIDAKNYVIEAEVQLGSAGQPLQMVLSPDAEAPGLELSVVGDSEDTKVDLRVRREGKIVATESELFRPVPNPEWGAVVEEELRQLAKSMAGWKNRWLPLRAELSEGSLWFYFDGRAIVEVRSHSLAASFVRFSLPPSASIRNVSIKERHQQRGSYLPLDLAGYTNSDAESRRRRAAAGLPGKPWIPSNVGLPAFRTLNELNGIPFLWGDSSSGNAQSIDVIESRWRGTDKRHIRHGRTPFNSGSALDGDPATLVLRVPKRHYNKMYALCASSPSQDLSQRSNVRLARYGGDNGSHFADTAVSVPRWNDLPGSGRPPAVPVQIEAGEGAAKPGHLWLVEIPLDSGSLQDVLAADVVLKSKPGVENKATLQDAEREWLEIDLTKQLEVGPHVMVPLGKPSGVQIYAVTLQESPVKMVVTSQATGHVFDASQMPHFDVWLENLTSNDQPVSIAIETRDPYGAKHHETLLFNLSARQAVSRRVELPQKLLGKFDVSFSLLDRSKQRLLKRATTFAILPPDTREAEEDSPFGLWSWGGGHNSPSNEVEAKLMRMAGARFSLGFNYPSKQSYGIRYATDIVTGTSWRETHREDPEVAAKAMIEKMTKSTSQPQYWQVYWEDMLSERHHRRFPPSLIGKPPLELNTEEQSRLKAYWDRADAYCRMVRATMPKERLALGAWANFTEEFLRRGFPKDYLAALSLEVGGFRFHPERPPDINSVNGLHFIQQWKKMYGYEGLDTIMVESLYHGTTPGYFNEHEQANYYVRDFLLALAYGVRLFGMSAMITDVNDDYYRSQWGSAGLFHRAPEVNPKESFVTYATMTRVLDRAKYAGYLDTGSTGVFMLHFKSKDGANVYPAWTIRGKRAVTVTLSKESPVLMIDGMHNERPLSSAERKVSLSVTESPVYVKSDSEVQSVQLGQPHHAEHPPRNAVLIDPLATLGPWHPRAWKNDTLEDGNPRHPRRLGSFAYSIVADPTRGPVLEVTPQSAAGSPLVPMYGFLERPGGKVIPGTPLRLGLWVQGNSGWGRVSFEFFDAKGERWIGVGGNEDEFGKSYINFDGWRWVEVDLCGHYDREYPRPGHDNWTSQGGDGFVDYPLTLTKLILELRDQVVHVAGLVRVKNQAVRLSQLMALY